MGIDANEISQRLDGTILFHQNKVDDYMQSLRELIQRGLRNEEEDIDRMARLVARVQEHAFAKRQFIRTKASLEPVAGPRVRKTENRTTCNESSCKCFCHVNGEPQGLCCGRGA